MFHDLNGFVKGKSNQAENQDGGDNHVKLEYLRAIDNQVAKSPSGSQKFTDDNAYQRQTDIDFCGA